MSKCTDCGSYYRNSVYNKTSRCDVCLDVEPYDLDSEYRLEMKLLQNPSGKTQPVFYDEPFDYDCDDAS